MPNETSGPRRKMELPRPHLDTNNGGLPMRMTAVRARRMLLHWEPTCRARREAHFRNRPWGRFGRNAIAVQMQDDRAIDRKAHLHEIALAHTDQSRCRLDPVLVDANIENDFGFLGKQRLRYKNGKRYEEIQK